jgi:Fe-S-cluster-containing hydrogenase component 2
MSVYELKNGKSVPVNAKDCIVCRTCESQCPEGAIQVIEGEAESPKVEPEVTDTPKKTKKKSIKKQTLVKSKKKSPPKA